jgi:hypothetical protein
MVAKRIQKHMFLWGTLALIRRKFIAPWEISPTLEVFF